MPFWKSVILAFYDGQRVFYKQKPHQTIYIAFDEKMLFIQKVVMRKNYNANKPIKVFGSVGFNEIILTMKLKTHHKTFLS